MFARVVTFAGGDPTRVEEVIAAVRARFITNGEKPASETAAALEEADSFMMLVDRNRAHILGITLFEDRDKLRRGDLDQSQVQEKIMGHNPPRNEPAAG